MIGSGLKTPKGYVEEYRRGDCLGYAVHFHGRGRHGAWGMISDGSGYMLQVGTKGGKAISKEAAEDLFREIFGRKPTGTYVMRNGAYTIAVGPA